MRPLKPEMKKRTRMGSVLFSFEGPGGRSAATSTRSAPFRSIIAARSYFRAHGQKSEGSLRPRPLPATSRSIAREAVGLSSRALARWAGGARPGLGAPPGHRERRGAESAAGRARWWKSSRRRCAAARRDRREVRCPRSAGHRGNSPCKASPARVLEVGWRECRWRAPARIGPVSRKTRKPAGTRGARRTAVGECCRLEKDDERPGRRQGPSCRARTR